MREAKKLLASGADLTARDEHLRSTPLAWAAKYGQLEMVKFLLRRGASSSGDGPVVSRAGSDPIGSEAYRRDRPAGKPTFDREAGGDWHKGPRRGSSDRR